MQNSNFIFTLRLRKGIRKLILSVKSDGSIVVTAPKRMSKKKALHLAEKFIQKEADWIHRKQKKFEISHPVGVTYFGDEDYKKHKEKARKIIKSRLEYFNTKYNYSFGRVSIRNQKSRWGSCSTKGNLNFSYKLLFLSERLRDYVIVHELCHLKELNHKEKFWRLVEQTFPDYKKIKKELKERSARL